MIGSLIGNINKKIRFRNLNSVSDIVTNLVDYWNIIDNKYKVKVQGWNIDRDIKPSDSLPIN